MKNWMDKHEVFMYMILGDICFFAVGLLFGYEIWGV